MNTTFNAKHPESDATGSPHRATGSPHGATALSTLAADSGPPPHRLGEALRAARVFAATAARVALLGQVDEQPPEQPRNRPPLPEQPANRPPLPGESRNRPPPPPRHGS